jgi:predicted O-methyltransferase YrrM
MKDLLDRWYERSQQIAPVRVAGLDRKRLMIHLGERGYNKGAEIGVDRGRFSEFMLQNMTDLHLLCVDPWYWKLRGRSRYESTVRRLEPFGERATIIRKMSMDALVDVKDGSLDFVYVDGDHTFDFVMSDIIWWARKVRLGGVVAAHDYYRFRGGGVVPAIDVYTQQHNITRWFLTDAHVDRTPTAFWLREPEPFELNQQ